MFQKVDRILLKFGMKEGVLDGVEVQGSRGWAACGHDELKCEMVMQKSENGN